MYIFANDCDIVVIVISPFQGRVGIWYPLLIGPKPYPMLFDPVGVFP